MNNACPVDLRLNAPCRGVGVWRRTRSGMLLFLATGLLSGCEGAASTLDPAGPRAERIAVLHWIMVGLGGAVYAGVLGLLAFTIFRSQRGAAAAPDDSRGVVLIVGGGIVLPLLILFPLWVLTLMSMNTITDPPEPPRLTVEITGHQWWYEVRYPQYGIRAVDEVHIPVGEPVLFELASVDVIHSFWVPRLAGKTDLIPGVVNRMWLAASEPGTFPVECAEFCGLMHARMKMPLFAEPPDQWAAWLARQQR